MTFTVTIPLRLDSMLNLRLHHMSKHRKVKAQREAVAWVVPLGLPVPCTVILTRIAPRELDGDNLQGAFKAVRDSVAQRLGVDDKDGPVTWLYSQERGKAREYGVRISITGRGNEVQPLQQEQREQPVAANAVRRRPTQAI